MKYYLPHPEVPYRGESFRTRVKKALEQLNKYYKSMQECKCFCPHCKSEKVEDNSMTQNNGIIGPGYSSWKVTNTRVCLDCGIIFIPTPNNTIPITTTASTGGIVIPKTTSEDREPLNEGI